LSKARSEGGLTNTGHSSQELIRGLFMRVVTGMIASRNSSFATVLDLCADGFADDPPKKATNVTKPNLPKATRNGRIVLLSAAR